MAKDVSEFFASENIDHDHLCGHSMAGKVALQHAADNASSIDGLVVVDIAHAGNLPGPRATRAHIVLKDSKPPVAFSDKAEEVAAARQ